MEEPSPSRASQQAKATAGAGLGRIVTKVSNAAELDIDWFSVEDVAVAVDKAVLDGLQRLWKQHAARMDGEGRDFAERMLATHRDTVQTIASIKNFDLASVLTLLNKYTSDMRDAVTTIYGALRAADDEFAAALYGAVRATFGTNLRTAIEVRDAWYHDKVQGLKLRFEGSLAAARASLDAEVARALEKQRRQIEAEARMAAENEAQAASGRPNMVEVMEKDVIDLKAQVAALQAQVADLEKEKALWQNKWAEELARSDSIRRECLAVIQRSEEHVSKLQHQHVSELSQRDYVLRRCKDTIASLEGQLGVISLEAYDEP